MVNAMINHHLTSIAPQTLIPPRASLHLERTVFHFRGIVKRPFIKGLQLLSSDSGRIIPASVCKISRLFDFYIVPVVYNLCFLITFEAGLYSVIQ